ncbi:hypothetical protein EV2_024247 [Malus domestica]
METQERKHANQKKQVYSSFGKLNEIKKYMAYMEWYKGHSKTMGIGYYDSYKNKGNTYDNDAEGLKNKLSRYWQDTVEEVERKPQKRRSRNAYSLSISWNQLQKDDRTASHCRPLQGR